MITVETLISDALTKHHTIENPWWCSCEWSSPLIAHKSATQEEARADVHAHIVKAVANTLKVEEVGFCSDDGPTGIIEYRNRGKLYMIHGIPEEGDE